MEFHWAHNVSLPRVGGAPHGWAQLCGCVRDGANPLWKPGTPFTTATLDSTTPVKQNMFHYNSGQTFGCVDKAGRIYAVVDYCIRQSPAHHRCSFEKHNCTGIVSFLSPPIPILFHLLLIPIPTLFLAHYNGNEVINSVILPAPQNTCMYSTVTGALPKNKQLYLQPQNLP